jgi:putative flippase GtrA
VLALLARPGIQQLLKFCIIGASSFVIDTGLLAFLHYKIGLSVAVANTISFIVAVTNGFIWNSRWTFKERAGDAKKQYPKFLATNIIGWILNLTIMTVAIVVAMQSGVMHSNKSINEIVSIIASGQGKSEFKPIVLFGAKVIATIFVMAWNFTAAKFFTFKQPVNTTAKNIQEAH